MKPDSPVPMVAIDGPSGVGKGTLAVRIAHRYGWHLLDSGALYRATGVACRQQGLELDDAVGASGVAASLRLRFSVTADMTVAVILDDRDITSELRNEEAGTWASHVATIPAVRAALFDWQQAQRQAPGLVADGRDMGTVVFPGAPVKFFLTATAEARAERRYRELLERGVSATMAGLIESLQERDRRDQERTVSPLRPADDAITIDSSTLSVDAVEEVALGHLRSAGILPPTG